MFCNKRSGCCCCCQVETRRESKPSHNRFKSIVERSRVEKSRKRVRSSILDLSLILKENTSRAFITHISLNKSCCDLNLGESLCIFTFLLFPNSGRFLLNGFDFYLIWRDTENQIQGTLFFLFKNIFYKNIEAELCEILRIF